MIHDPLRNVAYRAAFTHQTALQREGPDEDVEEETGDPRRRTRSCAKDEERLYDVLAWAIALCS